MSDPTLLAFVFILALFLGLELIGKVPALHTPLMSGSNAISGICLIGRLALSASVPNTTSPSS